MQGRIFFITLLVSLLAVGLASCGKDTTPPQVAIGSPDLSDLGSVKVVAEVVRGADDLEYVEFIWRKPGSTTWNLMEADLRSEDGVHWILSGWNLSSFQPGEYEVAAVGVDQIGNIDQDPLVRRFTLPS